MLCYFYYMGTVDSGQDIVNGEKQWITHSQCFYFNWTCSNFSYFLWIPDIEETYRNLSCSILPNPVWKQTDRTCYSSCVFFTKYKMDRLLLSSAKILWKCSAIFVGLLPDLVRCSIVRKISATQNLWGNHSP